ncbi:hypothetical protein [Aquibacillus sediminis]|uniref:hypothetical protein n=1 Tax=Aquibacillus sediminis TaxID=2574734 RepID=UPI001108063B|nr:hypothetical protein [Aquibacillus sediminis]
MNSKYFFTGFLILFSLLVGCKAEDEVDSPIYEGSDLIIGVIGKIPEVREENVNFKSITLTELESNVAKVSNEYDAVFIMKHYLDQAGENKFAQEYKELKIPVFFIESKKSYIPFIYDDMTYEEAPNMEDQTYATGIISEEKDTFNYWGYGLYNDTENETNIKDVYSRIFTTIESEVK